MNAPATRSHAPSTNQGKGSSAGSDAALNIPKLGDMPAKTLEQFTRSPPVVQDGEDPRPWAPATSRPKSWTPSAIPRSPA